MKLVNQYLDPDEAAAARQRLRAAGVATAVNTVDPHNIQPSKSGATRIGLWVLEDDQLQDALEILENPDHVPQRVLSQIEIARLEASVENRSEPAPRSSDKVFALILFIGLMALIVFTAIDFFID